MATRWRMPPESSRGSAFSKPCRPTSSPSSCARRRRSALSTLRSSSGRPMFSSTVYQGKRLASWKTRPSLRSASSSRWSPRHSGRPLIVTSPVARLGEAREDPQQRRLAAARLAEQRDELLLADAEVDVGQREGLAAARAEALRRHRAARSPPRRPGARRSRGAPRAERVRDAGLLIRKDARPSGTALVPLRSVSLETCAAGAQPCVIACPLSRKQRVKRRTSGRARRAFWGRSH